MMGSQAATWFKSKANILLPSMEILPQISSVLVLPSLTLLPELPLHVKFNSLDKKFCLMAAVCQLKEPSSLFFDAIKSNDV